MTDQHYIVPARQYAVQRFWNGEWKSFTTPMSIESCKSVMRFTGKVVPNRIIFVGKEQ